MINMYLLTLNDRWERVRMDRCERGIRKMPNPLGGLYDLGKGHIGSGYCRISIFQ